MGISAKCMPKRRKCAATTREAILVSAHEHFLAESYDAVGLREVARGAGVDVALVSRYFGSKEELFKQVVRGGKEKFELPETAAELPAFFLAMLSQDEDDERQHLRDKFVIMLRSATSAKASELVQQSFEEDVLEPLAAMIGGERAHCHAMLAMAVLIGTSFIKTVLPVCDLTEDDSARFADQVMRVLKTALEGGSGAATAA